MIFSIWAAVVLIGVVLTLIALFYNIPILFALAGVFWIVASVGASDVEFSVVYKSTGYDYLKDFNYPYLTLLFGLIGVGELILFGGQVINAVQMEVTQVE